MTRKIVKRSTFFGPHLGELAIGRVSNGKKAAARAGARTLDR